jgi:hypothetical protein
MRYGQTHHFGMKVLFVLRKPSVDLREKERQVLNCSNSLFLYDALLCIEIIGGDNFLRKQT